ncbi:MAG: hypothetical protein ACI8ZO_000707 [Flavobacteriales bacterium]
MIEVTTLTLTTSRVLTAMTNIKFILSALFLGFGSLANSQGLLWEISSINSDFTSYLYGTIHIQEKEVFAYAPIVEEKLAASKLFMPELILSDIDPQMAIARMLLPDSLNLKTLLSESDYQELDSICKKKLGYSVFMFNQMKPFFVGAQLMQADMKMDMPEALDMHLLKKAKALGLATKALETFEEQLSAIDKISYQDQALMLMDGLGTSQDSIFDALKWAYQEGNLTALMELMDDPSLPDNFEAAFLIERNVRMAERIDLQCQKQNTFFALGAAHLGGDNGLIKLLEAEGYVVNPIPFKFSNKH